MFHSEIQNNHATIKAEEEAYKAIPVIETVTDEDVQENYKRIKREIEEPIRKELDSLNEQQIVKDATQQSGSKSEDPKAERTPPRERKHKVRPGRCNPFFEDSYFRSTQRE